jgi:hypothetical protein
MSVVKIVRYATTPEAADENARLVRDVYAELAQTQPDGLRYATFRLDDGVTFVHLAVLEAEETRCPAPPRSRGSRRTSASAWSPDPTPATPPSWAATGSTTSPAERPTRARSVRPSRSVTWCGDFLETGLLAGNRPRRCLGMCPPREGSRQCPSPSRPSCSRPQRP